ncbi:hypothetical protein VTK73DRAFT_6093 [Phialemonium thermophilum]|uniref:Uncharacterized protein n=1 Tax=Phialemonium thermophilum TaxID=223376 RepID=A0ABR3WKL3_9PEZI
MSSEPDIRKTGVAALLLFHRALEKQRFRRVMTVAEAAELASSTKCPLQLSFSHASPSSPRLVPLCFSLFSEEQFDRFLSGQPPEEHRYSTMPLPEYRHPAFTKACRFTMLYRGVSEKASDRSQHDDVLRAASRWRARPLQFDPRDYHYEAFCRPKRSFTGTLIIRGQYHIAGIIQTPLTASDGDNGWASLFPGELSAMLLLLDKQFADYPAKAFSTRPEGVVVVNFTPTHVRVLEGKIVPAKPHLSIALHINKRHCQGLLPDGDGDTLDYDWRGALRWCFFLNPNPFPELAAKYGSPARELPLLHRRGASSGKDSAVSEH